MGEPLALLAVDAAEGDVDEVVRAFAASGFDVAVARASTPSEFEAALGRGPWDVVVSEWRLDGFSALAALKRMERARAEAPLIVYSREGGERNVVAALKAGAVDYILKGDPQALAAAAARELRAAAERRRARRRAEAQARLARALDQAGEGAALCGRDGAMQWLNPEFERIFRRPAVDFLGRDLAALRNGGPQADVHAELLRAARRGQIWRGRLVEKRGDGKLVDVALSLTPVRDEDGETVGFLLLVRDVTVEAEHEAKRRQHEKMDAVGRLAGGVAHDFNNLLQAVQGTTEVLKLEPERVAGIESRLDELERCVRRGGQLTKQLLLFARREAGRPEQTDLNEAIRDGQRSMQRVLGDKARLAVELSAERLLTKVDRAQLEQVLLSLVVNAGDAMPDGGEVKILSGRGPGEWVWFAVADTGLGIRREMRDRIFDPFFTTKGASRGGGLGLSVVHGIVTQHGGRVEVESDIGLGTVFRVLLPRLAAPSFPELNEQEAGARGTPVRGAGERLLVVEDEAGARASLEAVLGALGYAVKVVGSSEEALALPPEPPFELLLTDVLLPGISGLHLAKRLRDRWPGIKVVVMSGFSEDVMRLRATRQEPGRFLQKPFDMTTLSHEIRQALDEDRTPPPTPDCK